MRLRTRFRLPGWMLKASVLSPPTQRVGGVAQRVFSWEGLGAVLVGVLLAKWVWVFGAPASPAVPATSNWKNNDSAEHLFGTAAASGVAQAASSLGDIRLIGVFAHKTNGFAVLFAEGKQIGVGLGDEVLPGVRLVETDADYVVLERGGRRQRVDLPAAILSSNTASEAKASEVTTAAAPLRPAPVANVPTANNAAPPGLAFDFEAATAALDKLPPDQREAMRHQIEIMRSRH